MDILLNNLNFQFNNDGTVNYVQATFSGSQNGEYINAQVKVTTDDLNGKSFSDLTILQLREAAGSKFRTYVSTAFPPAEDSSTPSTPTNIKVDSNGTITAK